MHHSEYNFSRIPVMWGMFHWGYAFPMCILAGPAYLYLLLIYTGIITYKHIY